MNVVDSSGWLEYFGDTPNASEFAPAIEALDELIVPSVTLYEVYKRTCQIAGREIALENVNVMLLGEISELSGPLSISAARISLDTGLPLADAIILATARAHKATLWTQDEHFRGMEGVEYREPQGA